MKSTVVQRKDVDNYELEEEQNGESCFVKERRFRGADVLLEAFAVRQLLLRRLPPLTSNTAIAFPPTLDPGEHFCCLGPFFCTGAELVQNEMIAQMQLFITKAHMNRLISLDWNIHALPQRIVQLE